MINKEWLDTVEAISAEYKELSAKYAELKDRRIELMRDLWGNGASLAEIKELFHTSDKYLQDNIPEAFNITTETEPYIKNYVIGEREVKIYTIKNKPIGPPAFGLNWEE